jgi:hypothetical protein
MVTRKTKALITYLIERLQEPSTIRGIVLVASALGAKYNQELQSTIIEFGLIVAGMIAILTPDSILTKKVEPNKNTGDEIV